MILVGSQRGGYRDLATHLMKEENERAELHELRGFAGRTLHEALQESYAISKATHCRQHLFSLSLNPPKEAKVSDDEFRSAVDRAEKELGLKGQPRAIVFHDKRGDDGALRRHAHAVWCRIEPGKMKAVPLPFHKTKLQEVARSLYIEHGWTMPRGFLNKEDRDPRNFSLEEWQQCKRAGRDPRALKSVVQDAWALSDSRAGFSAALSERGLVLARGDRRGFVAVDHAGEVYALSRLLDVKTKIVRDRLGEPADLPGVADAHKIAAEMIATRLEQLCAQEARAAELAAQKTRQVQAKLKERQRAERQTLEQLQNVRAQRDAAKTQTKIRAGLFGLWDRLTGRRKRLYQEQKERARQLQAQARAEQERLRAEQNKAKSAIKARGAEMVRSHRGQRDALASDIGALRAAANKAASPAPSKMSERDQRRADFIKKRQDSPPERERGPDRDRPRGPDRER